MYTQRQILSYLSERKPHLLRQYRITKVGLFGSYARNEQRHDSDIDLVVEFEQDTPDLTSLKSALRDEMQQHFQLPVDICREKYIKPFFRQQILAEAVYV